MDYAIESKPARALAIAAVDVPTASEWDTIWRTCDYATYFHSRDWAELWSRQDPQHVVAAGELVLFSDGARALVPCSLRRRGTGLDSYSCTAEGMFGGWISRDSLGPEHARLLARHLLWGSRRNMSWRVNPYEPNHARVLGSLEGECVWLEWGADAYSKAFSAVTHFNQPLAFADTTYALDLRGGFDGLFRHKSGVVRDARKAAREGVTVVQAEHREQWQEYYRVYLDSVDRWKSDPAQAYPWSLFESLFELHSPDVRLWVALHEGRIISGALCLSSRRHVAYWHGAALARFFSLGSVNLLMLEIIRAACDAGMHWYDFNPSGYGSGVTAFKKKFHPRELDCPLVFVDRPVKRAARTLLMSLGR